MKKTIAILIALSSLTTLAQINPDAPDAPTLPVGTPWSAWWMRHSTNDATGRSNLGLGSISTLSSVTSNNITGQVNLGQVYGLGTLAALSSVASNNLSGQLNLGQVFGAGALATRDNVTSNQFSGQLNYGQLFGVPAFLTTVGSNNVTGQINYGQIFGVPSFLTTVTSNNISGQVNYGQLFGVPSFLTTVTSNNLSGSINYGQVFGRPTGVLTNNNAANVTLNSNLTALSYGTDEGQWKITSTRGAVHSLIISNATFGQTVVTLGGQNGSSADGNNLTGLTGPVGSIMDGQGWIIQGGNGADALDFTGLAGNGGAVYIQGGGGGNIPSGSGANGGNGGPVHIVGGSSGGEDHFGTDGGVFVEGAGNFTVSLPTSAQTYDDLSGNFNFHGGQTITANGDVLSGLANPSLAQDAATKNYVDTAVTAYVPNAGPFPAPVLTNGESVNTTINASLSVTNAFNARTIAVTNGISTTSNSVAAVTVGSSPFLFTNKTPSNIRCFVSGGAATVSVGLNGTTVAGSLAGLDYFLTIAPNEYVTLTYSIGTPTLNTNRW